METKNNQYTGLEVAIIGLACRVSEAENWREYWENLKSGKESIISLSNIDEESSIPKNFVGVTSDIKRKDRFDSSFFDYTPDEAGFLSPQNRIFHECVWEALEDAGYDPEQTSSSIGLYSGASDDLNWRVYSTFMNHRNPKIPEFTLKHLNNKDFMNSQVSYKLNLKGPSITTQTACSSSLVAIHMACKALLFGEMNMALAGGVSISTEIEKGYLHQEGSILSRDGHCRSFDEKSTGTVGGEGVGIVVLKRLKDALNEGDHIYGIIKGSAVNNDGKRKVGYTAPSIEGQVDCIRMAQKFSRVDSESINYVETHGTGTKLGDSIEVEALNIAFKRNKENVCPIGAVKTNIGHLDAAAGVAGLIKAVLTLKHQQIPATLHFTKPDAEINFEGGPFYVNTQLSMLSRMGDQPLRAGVNSFGVGGTNAHVILEEAPVQELESKENQYKLLTLSAKTEDALKRYAHDLSRFLIEEPGVKLTDMAYTMSIGRKGFNYRKSIVFRDKEDLIAALNQIKFKEQIVKSKNVNNSIVFLFPGQGSQYLNMGKGLYVKEASFRNEMDKGFSIIEKLTGQNFKDVLFSETNIRNDINETRYTQPLLFLFEYSLACLIKSYGINPRYMVGHSIGEYVAACISGVFSFEDALKLVLKRGELMNKLEHGSMLSVSMSADEAQVYLNHDISLAAINAPQQIVLSGSTSAIEEVMNRLNQVKVSFIKLHTSHAFHSSMQDVILEEFRKKLEGITFNKMLIPFVSNLTGKVIKQEEAESVDYWVRHMRETVRFSDGLKTLLAQNTDFFFIEVGAGHSLTSLLKQQATNQKVVSVNLVRSIKNDDDDERYLAENIGKLWSQGVTINWRNYYSGEKRRRVSLPTYSFENRKYLTEVDPYSMISDNIATNYAEKKQDVDDWFYRPTWKQSIWLTEKSANIQGKTVLIFSDKHGLAEQLMSLLINSANHCIMIRIGDKYNKNNDDSYTINPARDQDFEALFDDFKFVGIVPTNIFHLWNFDPINPEEINVINAFDLYQQLGYESLLKIARNFTIPFPSSDLHIDIISNGWYNVLGTEIIQPIKSTSLGFLKVCPLEFTNITCRAIDITDLSEDSVSALMKELDYKSDCNEISIRGKRRYVKTFEKVDFQFPEENQYLRKNGTYLITGANGGISKLFADFLAEKFQANLVLIGRREQNYEVINALEKMGSKVFYIQSDITDFDKISNEIAMVEKEIGAINGVIHTAGLGDTAGVIVRRTKVDDDQVFAPKIIGAQNLASIFGNRELDFFVNCSSQNASIANFGQVAYVAANLYLDAFAELGNENYPIISIEWSTLNNVGMSTDLIKNLPPSELNNFLDFCINPSEAIDILLRAIHLKIPTAIISKMDFNQLFLNYNNKIKESESLFAHDFSLDPANKSERPDLSADFVPASTDTEKALKNIYENFFGIQEVGIKDSFFELGGDSLKAMVILQKIGKDFDVEISLKEFFKLNAISDLSLLIEERLWINKDVSMDNEILL